MNMTTEIAAAEQAPIANVETEGAIIGALMIDNKQIDLVADRLSADDFYDPFFKAVFIAAVHERSLGNAFHPGMLRRSFGEEAVKTLAGLTGSGVVLLGAADFAKEIKELAQKRRLIEGLEAVVQAGRAAETFETETRVEELSAAAEAAIADATAGDEGEQHITAGKAAARVLDAMNEDRHAGVRSGIEALDATLGAIQPKNLIILAARPAMGKSATGISYSIGAAKRGHGVLFISLEMSADEIAERALADMCFDSERRVPFNAITSGNIGMDQGRELASATSALNDLPITIIDLASATISSIGRRVRRHKRRFAAQGHKLELVIVDYLQLVRPDHREKDRYAAISEVSLGLKQLAKAHDLGVLALCQLSREVEKRADKRPMLSDLRDSGSIEQDADSVLFLLRPEYYLKKEEPQADDEAKYIAWQQACDRFAGVMEFICAKRRRGPEGIGRGMYYGAYQAVR